MKIQSYILAIAVSIIGVTPLSAQTGTYYTIRDFQTWSSATLAYKLNKKVKLGISQELRLENNTSEVDKYFTEGFFTYKIAKPLKLGAELRFIRSNDNEGKVQGYENHLRHALNAQFSHKVNRFEFKYRFQYQSSKEMGQTASINNDPTKKLRLKVGGAYNIKKWKIDPVLSGEIFRTIGTNGAFSKIRGTIGTSYETKKAGELSFFFRMEKELNKSYPQLTNVIGFNYQYTLKRKKK